MFLNNKNIIFKIRRSKVTDYAAFIVVKFCAVDIEISSTEIKIYRGHIFISLPACADNIANRLIC